MGEEDKDQKTEPASEKRRQDSREKGRFAQSKEVTSASIMMGIIFALYTFGVYMYEQLSNFMIHIFLQIGHFDLTINHMVKIYFSMVKTGIITVAPIAVIIMTIAVIVEIIQGQGIVLTLDPLMPKFSKLNPLSGVKRLFSLRSFTELIKSTGKIFIVGFIAYKTVKSEFNSIPLLIELENIQILQYISWVSLKMIFFTLLALITLAIIDYAYQKYSFEESIKMSKQELKEERKDAEGDPRLKSRIRTLQLETARKRMMDAVPTADVIITNPTHLAIALKYDKNTMIAPQVVAKGADFAAAKIRDIAKAAGVPLIEDKPVARMIYKMSDIGQGIPIELYKTIAEIMAYVYKLKGR